MATRNRWMVIAVALAIPALPGVGRAEGNPQYIPVVPAVGPRLRVRTHQVNERFTRTTADNCIYSGALVGSVRELPGIGVRGAAVYNPRLTLQATLTCPNGRPQTTGVRSINVTSMSRAELLRALESTGALTDDHGAHTCTFTPAFELQAGRIVTETTVGHVCGAARGGGPRSDLPAVHY